MEATHFAQVVESMQLGTKTSMDAQKLLIHDSSKGEAAEGIHAGVVDGLGILVLALELEGEVIGQMATFVVPAQQPEGLGIVYLERPQVQDAFDAEIASVDVVAQEQIPGLGWVTAHLEQLHEIVVLAVHVAADGDGSIHLEEIRLLAQQVGARLDDPEGLLVGQPTLAVEVLLQEGDVGFGM